MMGQLCCREEEEYKYTAHSTHIEEEKKGKKDMANPI
jgi:hypothetical protein